MSYHTIQQTLFFAVLVWQNNPDTALSQEGANCREQYRMCLQRFLCQMPELRSNMELEKKFKSDFKNL